ncbi:MAG TPA: caspase family protein [Kofleriaceae bacterium]|nr:caspase family protein [Kofleriaceae bacterium]
MRAWIVVLGLVAAHPALARTVSYAVVIGNNDPPGDATTLGRLRYADDDAVRFYQLFSRFAQDARLLTVMDGETQHRYPGLAAVARSPTLANLHGVVAELAPRMAADRARGDEPVFYFVFSGHGMRSTAGEPFLALLDDRLTHDVLYDQLLAKLPASYAHLIIDACYAAAVVGVRGDPFATEIDATAEPVLPSELTAVTGQTQDRHPTVGALVATSLGEEAHEWSRIESGVFSHEVISGLLGAADVNGDGRVEYSELQAFIAAANRGVADPRAVLHVIALPPKINRSAALIALDELRDGVVLRGELSELGHFFIELGNGERYLDAHFAAGSSIALVLPAATRAFVRTPDREAEISPQTAGVIRAQDLVFRRREIEARGSIDASYRSALFSLPFGSAYYRGFVDSSDAVSVQFAESSVRDAAGRGGRGPAITLLGVTGAATATAAVSGVLAWGAKRDFDRTPLLATASEANDRYRVYSAVLWTSAAVAVAAAAGAWLAWPRSDIAVSATTRLDRTTGRSNAELAIGLQGVW